MPGSEAGTTTVHSTVRREAPSVRAVSMKSVGVCLTTSQTSVTRNQTTPSTSSAIFCSSPVPSHISSSGMKAGAGR